MFIKKYNFQWLYWVFFFSPWLKKTCVGLATSTCLITTFSWTTDRWNSSFQHKNCSLGWAFLQFFWLHLSHNILIIFFLYGKLSHQLWQHNMLSSLQAVTLLESGEMSNLYWARWADPPVRTDSNQSTKPLSSNLCLNVTF